MALTLPQRVELTQARFARWRVELARVRATPVILIGVSDPQTTGEPPLHVFVPHNDPIETALMVRTLRQIADELEQQEPQPFEERTP